MIRITIPIRFSCLILSASAGAFSGCTHAPLHPETSTFHNYAEAIDELSRIHEEYGSATFASPLLVLQGDRQYFQFGLENQNPDTYFDHAKSELQGAAAVSSARATVSSSGLQLQADLTQLGAGEALLQKFLADRRDYYQKKAQYEQRQATVDSIKLRVAREKLALALEEAKKKETPEKRETAINAAMATFAEEVPQLEPPGEFPEPPTAGSQILPEVPEGLDESPQKAREFLRALQFADHLGLLEGADGITNRDRTAIVTAAGDATVEGIFKVLGEADKAQQFKDKRVLYGVSMVSVQPGWRTRQGFEANISVAVERAYTPVKKVRVGSSDAVDPSTSGLNQQGSMLSGGGSGTDSDDDTTSDEELCGELNEVIPAVAAVSPMTDIQNLDFANSSRQAMERAIRIGLALKYFGFGLGFSSFNDYVNTLQQDLRTRSPQTPVAAYSNGHMFGYRIGPSLSALTEPGQLNTQNGYQLQNQSFPVLVIVGVDSSDVDQKPHPKRSALKCRPQLQFTQTLSWIPLSEEARKHRLSTARLLTLSEKITKHNGEQNGVSRLADRAKALKTNTRTLGLADAKLAALKNLTFGSFSYQDFPAELANKPKPAKFTKAVGGSIELPRDADGKLQKTTVTRVFLGQHLDALDLKKDPPARVVLGAAEARSATLVDNALEVAIDVDKAQPDQLILAFEQSLDGRHIEVTTPPIEVKAAKKIAQTATPEILSAYVVSLALSKDNTVLNGHVIVNGNNLKSLAPAKATALTIGGAPITTVAVSNGKLNGGVFEADFSTPPAGADFILRLPFVAGKGSVLTPPLEAHPEAGATTHASARLMPTVEYTTSSDGKTVTRLMSLTGGAESEAVKASVEIMQADLEKEKPNLVVAPAQSNVQSTSSGR